MKIPMLKIRRSRDRLIFNMGTPYTGKMTYLYWDGPVEMVSTFVDIRTQINFQILRTESLALRAKWQ